MQKSLHIDLDKCTGCLQCESACSLADEKMVKPAKSRIKEFNSYDARFCLNTISCVDIPPMD